VRERARYMRTKYATFTLSQVPDLERTTEVLDEQFEQFILAEQLGFDGVWIAEHLFSNVGVMGSTQVLAAAIARCTSKIRIGTGISIVAFNHPLRTASDFAAIDCMSHGRLNYGTGRAYQPSEFVSLGLDMAKSRDMYQEGLEIILKAWKGEPFTYDGQFWKIPNPTSVYPRTVQRPHPPIYTAAMTKESFVYAGQNGFHVLMAAQFSCRANPEHWLDDLVSNLKAYDQACIDAGHDPEKMERGLMIACHVSERSDDAEREYRPHAEWALQGNTARRAELSSKAIATFTYDDLKAAGGVVVGDVKQAVEQLKAFKNKLGLTQIILEFNKGGMPNASVQKTMRLFMSSIAPAIDQEDRRGVPEASTILSPNNVS
jgi:alkanesulfonate monooxygenase SsuD/methylene tetrahydromethanopterin reductase-like flavin-dependent oxidoreductase (luciferase family)